MGNNWYPWASFFVSEELWPCQERSGIAVRQRVKTGPRARHAIPASTATAATATTARNATYTTHTYTIQRATQYTPHTQRTTQGTPHTLTQQRQPQQHNNAHIHTNATHACTLNSYLAGSYGSSQGASCILVSDGMGTSLD
jgi:hypothetical protein